jgi:hypothetical protein
MLRPYLVSQIPYEQRMNVGSKGKSLNILTAVQNHGILYGIMESTKLTIRVPRKVLERAKQYAREHQTSLTRLVSEYLQQLPEDNDRLRDAPIVQRLSGILSADVSIGDYQQYLEEKYDSQAPSTGRS